MPSILIIQIIIKEREVMESNMPPVHPGAVLREDILKEMGLTVTKAAENLQVSRKQLSEVVNEGSAISAEMAVRLEDAFGVSAEFWLDMQKAHDIWKVKQSGRVHGIRRMQTDHISHAS
jgi:addiction module HigA family antidote